MSYCRPAMGAQNSIAHKLLKVWLHDHERTVRWFANMIGVSATTAHSWLSGRSRPTYDRMLLIEDLTGISPGRWLTESEAKDVLSGQFKIKQYKERT